MSYLLLTLSTKNKAAPASNAGLGFFFGMHGGARKHLLLHFRDKLRTFIPKPPSLKASACAAGIQLFLAAMGVHWLILSFLAAMDLCQASSVSLV